MWSGGKRSNSAKVFIWKWIYTVLFLLRVRMKLWVKITTPKICVCSVWNNPKHPKHYWDAFQRVANYTIAQTGPIRSEVLNDKGGLFLTFKLFLLTILALQHCSWSCFSRQSLFKWRGLDGHNHSARVLSTIAQGYLPLTSSWSKQALCNLKGGLLYYILLHPFFASPSPQIDHLCGTPFPSLRTWDFPASD